MKVIYLLLLFSFVSPQTPTRFEVIIPSAEQEAQYVWRTLQDMPFFEQHNYQISLPQGALIESLKKKSLNGQMSNEDYAALLTHMQTEVYDRKDYLKGQQKVVDAIPSLDRMLNQIISKNYDWGFNSFDRYQIVLTLYGPGGSYNPDEGLILLYTTTDGRFKQYDDPLNTLIHEVTHIGIESEIIQKYSVPHGLKERLVDTFVLLHFQDQLTGFRIQDMGFKSIDNELDELEKLSDLPRIVSEFMIGDE